MTQYVRRVIMIVTAADKDAANADAALIDPSGGGANTFGVPLSATGNDPATHYAADGVVRLATLAQIEALWIAKYPTGKLYRGHNEHDDELEITRYTFDEALTDAGLQRIEPEW